MLEFMKTTFLVVRHGQSEANLVHRVAGAKSTAKLTELGIKQAECVAQALEKENIDFIYSSPLERAVVTAQITANKKGLPFSVEQDLIELDFGDCENVLVQDLIKIEHPDFVMMQTETGLAKFTNGESVVDCGQRIKNAFLRLARKHQDKTIAIFTHSLALSALELAVRPNRVDNFRIVPANASISVFESDGESVRLIEFGKVDHLQGMVTGNGDYREKCKQK